MIDGLRAVLPFAWFSTEDWLFLRSLGDRILRVTPSTGEVVWETPAWEQLRTDVHQVQVRVMGDGVAIWGSPARCIGDGDAVFGSGAAAEHDLVGCLRAMVDLAVGGLGVELSREPSDWRLLRVDVTQNFLAESPSAARQVMAYLRGTTGGRYRVSSGYTESVYWSSKSTLRAAKAYLKGPHLAYLMRSRDYRGRVYTSGEVECAHSLVRLELELRRHHWRRVGKNWWEVTPVELMSEWETFFGAMIGAVEVTNETVRERIDQVSSSAARGRAAWGCWSLICAVGWEAARDSFPRASWYRHLKVLRAAGLSDASLSHGQVVPLRRSAVLRVVSSWEEFSRAA